MANCPKKIILATFLYLERLANLKGDDKVLTLKKGDAELISKKILDIYSKHFKDIEKVENSKATLPHEFPTFTMSSKSNLDSVNFTEYNKSFENVLTDRGNKYDLKTKYDVEISAEATISPSGDVKAFSELLNFEANKIVLENEDEVAYSFYKMSQAVNLVSNYIKGAVDYESDADMIARNFVGIFAGFKKTDILTNNEQQAEILEFNFTPSFIEEFENKINEEKSGTTVIDIEHLIGSVRDMLNTKTKQNIMKIIASRTVGMKFYSFTVNDLLDYEHNTDFRKEIEVSETNNLQVSVSSSSVINPIYKITTRSDEFDVYLKLDAQKKYLNDELIKEERVTAVPTKTHFSLANNKVGIEFDYIDNEDDVKLIRTPSMQASKDYFYHSDIVKNKKDFIMSVDESDAGAKGNKAKVLRDFAKKSDNIVLATGTFLDGYPKNIAYQMAYLDGIEDVKEFSQQLTEDFGVFSLKNNAVKNLLSAVITDKSISAMLYEAIRSFAKAKENSHNVVANFTSDFIKLIVDRGLIIGEMEFMEALNTYSYVFAKAKDIRGADNGLDILKSIIFHNRGGSNPLLKEEAGLQSVFSFIQLLNSQNGGHINIATRELLHNVKENIEFPDLHNHNTKKAELASGDLSIDTISDNNILSALMMNSYFEFYAKENHIPSMKYLLQTNFISFIESTTDKDYQSKANLDIVKPHDMTREEYIGLISDTRAKTSDGIIEQYKQYINNNGVIPEIADEAKQDLLIHLIEQFQKHFFNAMLTEDETEFVMKNYLLPEKLSNTSGEMIIADEIRFKNAYPYKRDSGEALLFSYDVGFQKKEWKPFLEKPIDYKYRIGSQNNTEIMNVFTSKGRTRLIHEDIANGHSPVVGSARTLSTSFNVCDAIAGAMKREDKTKPILIQIVQSAELKEVLNKIDKKDLMDNYNIELQIQPSSLISSEVNKAEARGIQAPLFTNIDAGARGLDLSSKGVSFKDENGNSKKHGKLYTTGTTVSSANLLQFFSRTFKPRFSESADISVLNGGGNIMLKTASKEKNGDVVAFMKEVESQIKAQSVDEKIMITDESATLDEIAKECLSNSVVEATPTFNDSIGERALEALKVSNEFMSGDRSDKATTNTHEIFEVSEAYQMQLAQKGVEINIPREIAV
jgi:hypothetical protein